MTVRRVYCVGVTCLLIVKCEVPVHCWGCGLFVCCSFVRSFVVNITANRSPNCKYRAANRSQRVAGTIRSHSHALCTVVTAVATVAVSTTPCVVSVANSTPIRHVGCTQTILNTTLISINLALNSYHVRNWFYLPPPPSPPPNQLTTRGCLCGDCL